MEGDLKFVFFEKQKQAEDVAASCVSWEDVVLTFPLVSDCRH